MKFGLAIPNCREGLYYPPRFASPQEMLALAEEAEGLGFASLWANDHLTPPSYALELYGEAPNLYDPLISLACMAERTSKALLGLGVAVLPLRDPVLLAKQALSLDAFAGGRFILGIGLGAYREEYERCRPGSGKGVRRRLMEEGLEALRLLLDEEEASYRGQLIKFEEIRLGPRVRRLPLYLGGNSRGTIRRASRLGDGWLPASLAPRELEPLMGLLREWSRRAGRDPNSIEVAPQLTVCMARSREEASRLFRASRVYRHLTTLAESTLRGFGAKMLEERNLIGTPAQLVERIEEYRSLGIEHLAALIFPAEDLEDYREGIRTFAKEVISRF